MNREVFLVQHVHELDDDTEDVKIIGIYSSERNAEEVVRALSEVAGFKDEPKSFFIDRYILDQNHWTDGYLTDRFKG